MPLGIPWGIPQGTPRGTPRVSPWGTPQEPPRDILGDTLGDTLRSTGTLSVQAQTGQYFLAAAMSNAPAGAAAPARVDGGVVGWWFKEGRTQVNPVSTPSNGIPG